MINMQGTGRIADLLLLAVSTLGRAGVEMPRLDAELLLSFTLKKSRTQIHLDVQEEVEQDQAHRFMQLIERRSRREPIAYITGECEFWSRTFQVNPAVLIPRPETEFLIEVVLARENSYHAGANGKCLDLCCGSGVIAIILALERGQMFQQLVGVDISRDALAVCRQNVVNHGVDDKVMLIQGNLGSCFVENPSFTLVTANPPYVSSAEMAGGLQPEVSGFEPHLALDGGENGLDLIRAIVVSLPGLLAPGGGFFMEIGADQAGQVLEIFDALPDRGLYESIEVLQDYAHRDRVVHARRKS